MNGSGSFPSGWSRRVGVRGRVIDRVEMKSLIGLEELVFLLAPLLLQ